METKTERHRKKKRLGQEYVLERHKKEGIGRRMEEFARKLLEAHKDEEPHEEIFVGALRKEIKKILEG